MQDRSPEVFHPVTQDKFGTPNGNCYSACVGSLVGLSMEELRPFEALYRTLAVSYFDLEKYPELQKKLWAYGWGVLLQWIEKNAGFELVVGPAPAGQLYIATGLSPRGPFNHSVIYRDQELVWDPHPDRTGLVVKYDDQAEYVRRIK